MYEVIHKTQGVGERAKYRYADIYVKNLDEARAISTSELIQGSKLYVVETAELFVLNEDEGQWCSVVDGAVLTEG